MGVLDRYGCLGLEHHLPSLGHESLSQSVVPCEVHVALPLWCLMPLTGLQDFRTTR
jgi:hypothetical protein